VKRFRVSGLGDRRIILKWDAVENADGYILYRYYDSIGGYKRMAVTRDTMYMTKKLKKGTIYKFKIQAYRTYNGKKVYSKMSAEVSGRAKSRNLSSVHSFYFTMELNCNATATYVDTGKTKTLKKGTQVTVTSLSKGYITEGTTLSGTVTATLTNGRQVTLRGSALTYKSVQTTKKYYSNALMEAYVNTKGYESDTDYLIWISQYTMSVAIFKGSKGEWKLVRKCPAVVGRDGATPRRENYRLVRYGERYGGVFIYIAWFGEETGGYGFHRRVSRQSRGASSGGCIRLGDDDLNYMYQNCPLGTKVISY
jgi:hypothetical protein